MEWLQVQFLLPLLTPSYKVYCNILCISQSALVIGGGHR